MTSLSDQSVLVLDDDEDLRDLVGLFLEDAAGVRCLLLGSVAELMERRDEALRCSLAILDVNLGFGEPTGIDAREWLRANGFEGRVVFLTGHARQHPALRSEAEREGLQVLEKPVDPETLVALVRRSVRARPSIDETT